MAAIKSVEKRQKEFLKASEKDMNKAIADSDKLYTGQANTTKELYEGQISDTKKAYEDDYRENAIQKLVNEREVAESMANMGLTDSGLNRTQQTAVQLSYANQKADIDNAKQNQINAFLREMNSKLADIEQNRLASNASIKSGYEQNAWDRAAEAYKTDVDAATEKYKAEQSQIAASNKAYYNYLNKQAASNKAYYNYLNKQAEREEKDSYIIKANDALLSRDYKGTLKSNGVTSYKIEKDGETYVRYVDSKSGKKVELKLGVNPYTGKFADDVLDENGYYDSSKAFKGNGYQPNNIGGKPISKVDGAVIARNENNQSVWTTGDDKYYYWRGEYNSYKLMNEEELKKVGLK